MQGDVTLAGAAPGFNKEITKLEDTNELVPFRMTRMLTTLLSPVPSSAYTHNPQHSTLKTQHSTLNIQHSTLNHQPSILNP